MSETSPDAVGQWLARAHSDWQTVEVLLSDPRSPAETICYHCQQHVEKLLKALLTRLGIEAPRTHELRRLIDLASPHAPALEALSDASDLLSFHAVASRYPDDWREVPRAEAVEMVALARAFRDQLLPMLGR